MTQTKPQDDKSPGVGDTPPDFRPHPRYAADLEVVRRAFRAMAQ